MSLPSTDDDPTELRNVLERAIGTEPPLGFTAAEVRRAGARRVRGRRAGAAVGSVAVLALAVGVGVPVLVDDRGSSVRPAAGGTSAASPAPTTPAASPPAPVRAPESGEDPARAAVRLAAAVRLPSDLTLRNLNGEPGGGLRFDFGKNEIEDNPDAAMEFFANVSLTGPGGKGFLEVTVQGARPAGYPKVGDLCDDEATDGDVDADVDRYTCTSSTAPGGARVVVFELKPNPEGHLERIVLALRPDGTRASASTNNLLRDSAERPGRTTHQLSVRQLTAIVLDPALSYYP